MPDQFQFILKKKITMKFAVVAAVLSALVSAGFNDLRWYGLPSRKNGGSWYAGQDVAIVMAGRAVPIRMSMR